METLIQDVRFAVRSLRKNRTTTIVAVLCLALGIGANTAIFSVVRAVLLDSLPYRDPQRLLKVTATYIANGERGTNGSVSPDNFRDWRDQSPAFEDMAAYRNGSVDLGDVADPERLRGILATANLFALLGARPLLGRAFTPADDSAGTSPVVVISEGLWRRRFGSDQGIIGTPISLGGTTYTVIGVMPARFDFPISPLRNDVWRIYTTTMMAAARGRTANVLNVVGRLAAGADSTRAASDLTRVTSRIAQDYPESQKNRGALAVSLGGTVVGNVRAALLVLLGAAGVLLLIACANVANLLLARAAGRRREIAIRTALGGSRGRLLRQLLTESLVLSAAGGLLGVAAARAGLHSLVRLASETLPRAESVRLDGPVLAFVVLVSVATGLVFGVAPALRASRADLREDLSESTGRSGVTRRQHRTLHALIVVEIALSLVLLVGAGLLIRGFVSLLGVDPGFQPSGVLAFHAASGSGTSSDSGRYDRFYGPVLERLRTLPGVRSAAFTDLLPIQDPLTDRIFSIVGRAPVSNNGGRPDAQMRTVSSEYFRTLGIAVLAGREFAEGDISSSPRVVMINDELQRRFFAGENPLGQLLDPGDGGPPATIVGVVRSVRQRGLDQDARAEFYLDARQNQRSLGTATFVLSSTRPPESYAASVRQIVHEVAPQQPVYELATMTSIIGTSLAGRRLILVLLALFATFALVLSAAGVYGVMSYGVSQRTREIGIRIALGARSGDVVTMVLRDAAKVVGMGLGIGIVVAVLVTRLLGSMLYAVGTHDLTTFAAVTVVIAVTALLATVLPARRAVCVDPLQTTRAE